MVFVEIVIGALHYYCFATFGRQCDGLWRKCKKEIQYHARTVPVGRLPIHHQQPPIPNEYPPNVIRNQKYSVISFIPKVLQTEFLDDED